ncbi:hypothetical protein NSA19_02755 [Actinomyces bowdenii]|uniref:hypothetical protein n=1 Tax=Actinomyces bowdenii TaxID=131109 RepID=UPI00214BF03D|nr:hypothetical protein [Actinomyces bowdenii]MCR2051789.1 hypothetical protein [Actinomyces bowdenii]
MSSIVHVVSTRHPGAPQWPVGQTGLQVGPRLAVQHEGRVTVVSSSLYHLAEVIGEDGADAFHEWHLTQRALASAGDEGGPAVEALEADSREQAEHLLAAIAGGEPACQVIAPIQARERTLIAMVKGQSC